eukprot:scaffold27248_cov62-Phaeocystis_antarctica.AAC.5
MDEGGELEGEALVCAANLAWIGTLAPDNSIPCRSADASSPRQVNLTSENPVTLSAGTQLDFTYSVDWSVTSTPFHRRFDRYLDYDFFEHQVGVHTEHSTST